MKEVDIPKKYFDTHESHCEFLFIPFILCNALSTFYIIMNKIFYPLIFHFVLVFFDDILAYSPTVSTQNLPSFMKG